MAKLRHATDFVPCGHICEAVFNEVTLNSLRYSDIITCLSYYFDIIRRIKHTCIDKIIRYIRLTSRVICDVKLMIAVEYLCTLYFIWWVK